MVTIHYSTVDEKLKQKIIKEELENDEIEGIKVMIKEDGDKYFKARKKYNFFAILSLITFILPILMVLLISVLPFENGSPEAKVYVMIIAAIFGVFIISILVTAFLATRFAPYIHVPHALKLMKKHYPHVYEGVKR